MILKKIPKNRAFPEIPRRYEGSVFAIWFWNRLYVSSSNFSTQTVEAAKADGERIKVLGLAEATAIGDVGKADAERMLAKAKVYKQYGDAAIMALVLEALPKVKTVSHHHRPNVSRWLVKNCRTSKVLDVAELVN